MCIIPGELVCKVSSINPLTKEKTIKCGVIKRDELFSFEEIDKDVINIRNFDEESILKENITDIIISGEFKEDKPRNGSSLYDSIFFSASNIAELSSSSFLDFEESFIKFLINSTNNKIFSYLQDFGQIKFGEIDNSLIEDFEIAFNNFFFKSN